MEVEKNRWTFKIEEAKEGTSDMEKGVDEGLQPNRDELNKKGGGDGLLLLIMM